MKKKFHLKTLGLCLAVVLGVVGCNREPAPTAVTISHPTPTPLIKVEPMPVTMPLIDALFSEDQTFGRDLMDRVPLTDGQIALVRTIARVETGKLDESGGGEQGQSTTAAAEYAKQKLVQTIGEEKAEKFALIVQAHSNRSVDLSRVSAAPEANLPYLAASPLPIAMSSPSSVVVNGSPTPTPGGEPTVSPTPASSVLFGVPVDTRVIVNAPAHRMDAFENGRLVKSYLITIGYPAFPIPYGERKAGSIIFNPTWTPPDEPWVESSNKVKVGQRVAAGDKLNPLGALKIPVGMPSLIHGGKRPVQIGKFGSHGCVGLTDDQAKDFAKHLAVLGGVTLNDEQIEAFRKTPNQTKLVKLNQEIPVEFRYDTIIVSDGKLHIYRDVYDRDTNTEENLRLVLGVYGVSLDDFSAEERRQAVEALERMSHPAAGKSVDANLTELEKKELKKKQIESRKLLQRIQSEQEVVIDVAALVGKGYPAPVDLNDGQPPAPVESLVVPKGKKATPPKKTI